MDQTNFNNDFTGGKDMEVKNTREFLMSKEEIESNIEVIDETFENVLKVGELIDPEVNREQVEYLTHLREDYVNRLKIGDYYV